MANFWFSKKMKGKNMQQMQGVDQAVKDAEKTLEKDDQAPKEVADTEGSSSSGEAPNEVAQDDKKED